MISAQIAYEHWHRYFYAGEYVQGKKVLDIASGEGYGSYYLSRSAESVMGVDISKDAVTHAQGTYTNKNLEYREGSVDAIPVEGNGVFDVIVSFETIEHIDEKTQHAFMKEVQRLLKSTGVLIISTPNKHLYSDVPGSHNEFHIKEFQRDEFSAFLKGSFKHVEFLGQKIFGASFVWPLEEKKKTSFSAYKIEATDTGFVQTNQALEELYVVAVCSNTELDTHDDSSLLIDIDERFLKEKDELIAHFRQHNDQTHEQLSHVITAHEKEIQALLQQKQMAEEEQRRLAEQIHYKDEEIQSIHSSWSWKLSSPLRILGTFVRNRNKKS